MRSNTPCGKGRRAHGATNRRCSTRFNPA
jgi:hypothetical protein